MSWKNHVPDREPDFEMTTRYENRNIRVYSGVYFVRVSVWVKEEVVKTEQGKVGEKPRMFSVDRGNLQCPYRIDYMEWQNNLADAILLGE